jgi:hypothetical protein
LPSRQTSFFCMADVPLFTLLAKEDFCAKQYIHSE